QLREKAAQMTSAQRLAEIESILKATALDNAMDVMNNWGEIFATFQALMLPEDLEALKKMALEPPAGGGSFGMPQMSRIAFQAAFITNWADWDESAVESWVTTYKEPGGGFMVPVSLYA